MKCQRIDCQQEAAHLGTVYMVDPISHKLVEKEVYACKKHSEAPGFFKKAKIV